MQRIERWLRDDVGSNVLRDHDHAMPKLDGSLTDAIDDRRRQAGELRNAIAKIAAAPRLSSVCKQQMRMQIARLAAQGTPSLESLIDRGGDIEFARTDMHVPIIAGDKRKPRHRDCFMDADDPMATLVWLLRDTLLKKLDSEIDAASDDGAALDDDERQRRQSETQALLLDCERDIAALIFEAQRQGLPVEFPADIAPMAILSVEFRSAAPANPSPGSAIDHAMKIVGLR